jgi:ParB family transcriptional regulator, chromosome partitioning protein
MAESIISVLLTDIDPNPYQPESRLTDTMEDRASLMSSIERDGLHQIPVGRLNAATGRYEMADGWRRLIAYTGLRDSVKDGYAEKFSHIPLSVKEMTNQQMADAVIDTNLTKKSLTPIDLAKLYARYLKDFRLTQAGLAKQRNISQGEIANSLRLLELPEEVQKRIITQEITETHGRALLQLKDKKLISGLAAQAAAEKWTVAQLDDKVKREIEKVKPRLIVNPEPSTNQKPFPQHMEKSAPPAVPTVPASNEIPEETATTATTNTEPTQPITTMEQLRATSLAETEALRRQSAGTPEVITPPVTELPVTPATAAPVKDITPSTVPAIAPHALKKKRKLILEEKDGFVQVSAMCEGGFPVFDRCEGMLEAAVEKIESFLTEAESIWNKEKK